MSGADKRFDPTPSRRERAKREGNVAQSAELNGMAAFAAATAATLLAVPFGAAILDRLMRGIAAHPLHAFAATAWFALGGAALAPLAAAALAGTGLALVQRGGLRASASSFQLGRLSAVAGIKRIMGLETAVGVARAACGFAAALGAVVPLASELVAGGVALRTPPAAAVLVGAFALRAFGAALAVGLIFAALDVLLARRRWLRGLKMTLHEMKRDAKENEGDPHARARRKGAHRAIVRGAIGRVREASFVVVNPTHVAVALRYAPPAVPVPEILVRALDDAAVRVRALARDHVVPIVEDAPLARLLYAQGENGRAIPPDTYVAVAHTIAALARQGLL